MDRACLHINDCKSYFKKPEHRHLDLLWLEEIADTPSTGHVKRVLELDWDSVKYWNGNTPWPTWHNRSSAYYLWISTTDSRINPSQEPKKLFLCLNNNSKLHRLELMAELYKNQLFDHGIFSFASRSAFKWMPLTERWLGKHHGPHDILPVIEFPISIANQTAMSVITESYISKFDISEKTFQCLAVGQPFIAYGCQGLHHRLFEWGFKPLPDWDYEFDLEPCNITRKNLIVEQLTQWSKYEPANVKKYWQDTATYNRNHFRSIIRKLRLPFDLENSFIGHDAKRTFRELHNLQKLLH